MVISQGDFACNCFDLEWKSSYKIDLYFKEKDISVIYK